MNKTGCETLGVAMRDSTLLLFLLFGLFMFTAAVLASGG
jgi:hypothetical protein